MRRNVIKLTIMLILISALTIPLTGITICEKRSLRGWQYAYDAYTGEDDFYVYHSFNATIEDWDRFIAIKENAFKLIIDEEDYYERNKDTKKSRSNLAQYKSLPFSFIDESIVVLEANGFFEEINKETEITFTVNSYVAFDDWSYPVFGVEANGKTYLDFETGYEHVINYVQNIIDEILNS